MSGITGTSTTLSGLEQGTSYYIWVAAVSSGEQGPYSIRIIKTTYSGKYNHIITVYIFCNIMLLCMKNLRYHSPTCYTYSVKEPIGELNLKRALDEDTGIFSSFFHLLLHWVRQPFLGIPPFISDPESLCFFLYLDLL